MTVPAYLLLLLGLLGGTDIALFHTLAHRLRQHRPARAELVTHFLRGPTYATLFLLVPNFTFHGAWLVGLLLFDLGISMADFWLEPASRQARGGLPRGEYLLHVWMAMLFGGLCAAVWYEGGSALGDPASLQWQAHGAAPWLRVVLAVMAPMVLGTGILDLVAVVRLGRQVVTAPPHAP
ncbi:MAG TPA: hypothetical protein VK348_11140 [Planctomycetota bacterium]|nr:hypothetical protein [Planctomycetota bacterium]